MEGVTEMGVQVGCLLKWPTDNVEGHWGEGVGYPSLYIETVLQVMLRGLVEKWNGQIPYFYGGNLRWRELTTYRGHACVYRALGRKGHSSCVVVKGLVVSLLRGGRTLWYGRYTYIAETDKLIKGLVALYNISSVCVSLVYLLYKILWSVTLHKILVDKFIILPPM